MPPLRSACSKTRAWWLARYSTAKSAKRTAPPRESIDARYFTLERSVSFDGAIGNTQALADLDVTAATINLTDAADTNFNATFTAANNSNGNYVKFTINASGFTGLKVV